MEKKAILIFSQIDHVSGEVAGFAVERLIELGANNVQLIPTITKKNRPGNIIIIDADAEREEQISNFLAKELKVSGYHRIDTSHVFFNVTFIKKNLNIKANGKKESLQCEIKLIGDPKNPLSIVIDHDFLVKVKQMLNEKASSSISLIELRSMIESRLRESEDEITIEI